MKRHEYPSRDEAMRYRAEIQEAVQAARRREQVPKSAVAWPAGLDRRLLLGLPIDHGTRNSLLRGRVAAGDKPLTVGELLRVGYPIVLRLPDLLRDINTFLDDYIETFDEIPGPAEVAAMRLTRELQRLSPRATTCVEERLLARPP